MASTQEAVIKLKRILLSWDYWNLYNSQANGQGAGLRLKELPNTFESAEDYVSILEPLVLEECSAQLVRGNEEAKILQPHEAFLSLCTKEDDFLQVRLTLDQRYTSEYGDNDMVLVSSSDPDKLLMMDDFESLDHSHHALGHVEAHEGEQSLRVRFYLTDASQIGNPKGMARVRWMRTTLASDSKWYILKLASMSTIVREWVALHNVPYLPFRQSVLTAQPPLKLSSSPLLVPEALSETIRAQYNASQVEAMTAGLEGTPVTLIQGPPGTGKTRTILGLLSIVLHSAPRGSPGLKRTVTKKPRELSEADRNQLWIGAAPWMAGRPNPRDEAKPHLPTETSGRTAAAFGLVPGPGAQPPQRVGARQAAKPHVLVCAPSNSALDEIVSRILTGGILAADGSSYRPDIVRVGVNVHHSVAECELDRKVEARMGATAGQPDSGKERDRQKLLVLEEAAIVCSTLSFSGSGVFGRMSRGFDVVIIDEASQATEPSVLIPMALGCKQVFLVGDPVQLPATVISKRAVEFGYDISMFKRLQGAGHPVQVLDTQYRMHPSISVFPSREFYGGSLKDGPGVAQKTERPWHKYPFFGPLAFFDVGGRETIPDGSSSLVNEGEVEAIMLLISSLGRLYPNLLDTPSIAVITPYKAQVNLLREKLVQARGKAGARIVDINTIDGFQGREKDITIFSCVRSALAAKGKKARIGFVADERRINVGLTRARSSLIVVGNGKALKSNEHWKNLINHSKATSCYNQSSKPFAKYLQALLEEADRKGSASKAREFVPEAEEGAYGDDDMDDYSD